MSDHEQVSVDELSFEQALAVARQTGSQRLVEEAVTSYAMALNDRGRYAEARRLLEGLPVREFTHSSLAALACALYHLGDHQAAIDAATLALENAARASVPTFHPLIHRALAYEKLGRMDSTLSDIRRALDIVESNRTKLIPTDYLKRGFEESKAGLYETAIGIFHRAGLPAEAFEVAEKARARAFLDLIASRELQRGIDDPSPVDLPEPDPPTSAESIELKSLASIPALSAAEVRERAASIDSTILSYWVGQSASWVWMIPPAGDIRSARLDTDAGRLGELVRRTGELGLGVTRGSGQTATLNLLTRGGHSLGFSHSAADPWRDAYRVLVDPVAAFLPKGQGKRITVVPHGPIFGLSFAALKSARDRYLIEDFTLSYTPSVALLGFASAGSGARNQVGKDSFLVADPRRMPFGPDGKPLPPLPGTRAETRAVARLLASDSCLVLTGTEATEPAVRKYLADRRILHFATHGVLRDDQALESYLALGRVSGSASADGRLTAAEIYALRLNADLVVLSACRSGLGPISGDGVNGLTRAFFYAGARTVMATLWDVPDQPTNRLISSFYRHYRKNGEKSVSLRTAQLELLAELRGGRIFVDTALGPVKLPESSLLWAGFVVIGEP